MFENDNTENPEFQNDASKSHRCIQAHPQSHHILLFFAYFLSPSVSLPSSLL